MKIYGIYFSPTGSTERIVTHLAKEFGDPQKWDLSKREESVPPVFAPEDICVIGVPSYGGRVPAVALERMASFRGNGAKAVLVVSYGNRAYDDTLRELEEFVQQKGFACVAAIAAVAEHSIMHQFAAGRPDGADLAELSQFAKRIREKLDSGVCDQPSVPGNFPYREYNGVPLKPQNGRKCTACGLCAKSCPVGAIPADDPQKTDKSLCISCMRCVKVCPHGARSIDPQMLQATSQKLAAACASKKPNEIFL